MSTAEVIDDLTDSYDKVIRDLKKSLSKIRTGRASTDMLDDIRVEYYGDYVPLNQVSTIRVSDPRLLVIQPWEKDMIPKIEKAIRASDLGLNPQSDSDVVRVPIPQLSGERREELSKLANSEGEDHKITIRNARREANDMVEELEDASEISEDDMHRTFDEIDKLTKQYQQKVDNIVDEKVEKIRAV